jgi:hypothetical protein
MADALKQRFNDDLLLKEEDRDLARRRYPSALVSVLYFEDLCTHFKKYDAEANEARRKRRGAGTLAILAGMLALFGASAAPLYHQLAAPWPVAIGGLASFLGVASVLVGLFGIGSKESQETWLLSRLMTERLRQVVCVKFSNLIMVSGDAGGEPPALVAAVAAR